MPFWSLYRRVRRPADGSEELLSVYRDHGVVRKSDRSDNFNKASDDLSLYQVLRPGDLVINKMKAWQGSVAVSPHSGIVSPAYFVFERQREADGDFLHHLLRSDVYVAAYRAASKGIRPNQWDLDPDLLRTFPVHLPALSEQSAIARFIGEETAEIDAFIADQEDLIALLTERRAATISHAVTKGLDPSAPMKDSGVEWFGDLPAHWKLFPLGFAANFQEGPGIGAADFRDDGIPLIRVSGVRGRYASLKGANYLDPATVRARWRHFQVREGDLLISASASMGTVSEVGREVARAVPYTGIIRMNPTPVMTRDFLRLCLQSAMYVNQIDRLKTGSTIQHYGPQHLRAMYLPVPPLVEQKAISSQVESELATFDAAVTDARQAVALSRERRAALISAAVTGKIDVRNHGGVE